MEEIKVPHVVFLPFPLQGHIKPMMKLAELLGHEDFQITFVNTDLNHDLLLGNTDITSFCNRFPKFQFRSIPSAQPSDLLRSGIPMKEVFDAMKAVYKPAFREVLTSQWRRRPTCIITDGLFCSLSIQVGEELQIPVIAFRTASASCTWTYFHISNLIEQGELPFPDSDMDKPITSIPGFENVFRRKDLPGICRVDAADEYVLEFILGETSAMTRASALILNTCYEIEAPIISRLASLYTKIYTIGPLDALFKSRIRDSPPSVSSNGILRKEDKSCLTWLDAQPSRSVLYVSFGSLVGLTRDQMFEFWYGIVNSGKRFLWVMRSDLITEESENNGSIQELQKGTKERGCIISWAPQEEVLAHPAIGGFLTHSGWNSTLESIVAGVPMICWPQIADQNVNSRCVSEVWKIGFDMKDTCDRSTIEMLVRDLMDNKRVEIRESTDKIAEIACDAVKEEGSSYSNLEKLIENIRSMARTV